MHTSLALLLELGVILVVLSALGTAARRFGLPSIPLYLVAGLALGEGGLGGGERIHPRTIGGIQTGWGWVQHNNGVPEVSRPAASWRQLL